MQSIPARPTNTKERLSSFYWSTVLGETTSMATLTNSHEALTKATVRPTHHPYEATMWRTFGKSGRVLGGVQEECGLHCTCFLPHRGQRLYSGADGYLGGRGPEPASRSEPPPIVYHRLCARVSVYLTFTQSTTQKTRGTSSPNST